MTIIEGQVGLVPAADGARVPMRLDRQAAQVVQDAHGRFTEAVYRGGVFVASTQAGVALSTALSTTQTGFTLTNPAGSGKNLFILQASIALTTAPAGIASLVWAANTNPTASAVVQTTPLTVRNALLGSPLGAVGLAASAVTLPAAPAVVRPVGGGPVATGSVTTSPIIDPFDGGLALAPGTALSLSALTTAISAICSLLWEELPV
jgi:hypothetical protein